MAFVLPGAAVVTNKEKNVEVDPLWIGKERVDIKEAKTWNNAEMIVTMSTSANLQISGWAEGDDIRPSITKTDDGLVFITYQNDLDFTSSGMGFSFNYDPMDAEAWFNNGVILTLDGVEIIVYPDTATCDHPTYKLMNVFAAFDTEEAGGMYIADPTDYTSWEIYTWTEGAPEIELAQISDGGWYTDKHFPEVVGPFNFYIYREIYDVYDISQCPICFHTGIDENSGVGYFDAQEYEQTAPAGDPDMVNLADRFHTSIYNVDTEKVIWKKIDPTVETDYEYTPYQATVADGTNPSIAAYDDNVAIVYHHNGMIKCVYSSDDGETWSQPVAIDQGQFPDVYAHGSTLFAGYVKNGNLYVVSSKDGGVTWTAPEQKNDVAGTVVAEENCIDVHIGGVVWVDERNGAYNIYYTTLITPPDSPTITGPAKGDPNKEYSFKFVSTDPTGSDVYYYIEWGDGDTESWLGPYSSGEQVTVKHTYSTEKVFNIRAKAKNMQGFESDWSTYKFSTPKQKTTFLNLLERFPILFNFFKTVIGM